MSAMTVLFQPGATAATATALCMAVMLSACAPTLRSERGVRVVGDVVRGEQTRNVSITTRNQDRLNEIALGDPDDDVREAAVLRLASQPVLAKIAAEDRASSVRLAAVSRMKDEDNLILAATSNSDPLVRLAALNKIDRKSVV